MNTPITEFHRRVLLALIDVEAARVASTRQERRAVKHRLFALIRERFGCKYTLLPAVRYREAAQLLLDEPLR
ncbi:MAG: hypothetical protein J1E80_06715 [Desulfovibrionaceae bacterium]|nr:hypothetical protein [Desulfovibrionaceae bacterium]